MSIFKKGHNKSPCEIVKNLKSTFELLKDEQTVGKKLDKANEDVTKGFAAMKGIMCCTEQQELQLELSRQLAMEIKDSNILHTIIEHLSFVGFEGRKDFVHIFSNLMSWQMDNQMPIVKYFVKNSDLLLILITGYEDLNIALCCGALLRECIRCSELAMIICRSESFFKFFSYVDVSTFDVATDAFATFRELLTFDKMFVAAFLEEFFDRVFLCYNRLLSSENYVTKRQSLKLLSELLSERQNYIVMTKYISKPENLKIIMVNLKDESKSIQYEAFHVFKIFVANPNKTKPIVDILLKNQQKLVYFLSSFLEERTNNEQFKEERAYLLKQVQELQR